MSVTFNFQAPNTQTGGDNVNAIKIYSSSDSLAFTLEATATIVATDTSYVYAAGDASTYYRISFTDTDGYESPQSDTMYGDSAYMGSDVADIINKIRIDIGDDDSTNYTYTDTTMKTYVDKAVNYIIKSQVGKTSFNYSYSAGAITPSISEDTNKNNAIKYLIVLAIECMIAKREYKIAIGKGISIADGDTKISTTGGLANYSDFVSGKDGACSEFRAKLREFIATGGDGSSGSFVAYY